MLSVISVYPFFGKWTSMCQPPGQGDISVTLQDRLDAFTAAFLSGKPGFRPSPEQQAAMDRATEELIASGQAQRAKKAGDVAPDFTLNDSEGKAVSSRELLAKG